MAYQPHGMTSKLKSQAIYMAVPMQKIGVMGLGIRNYPISQVSSFLNSNLVYAKSFGGIITSSFSANYHRYYVKEYVSDNAFSLDLGLLVRFSEVVNV